MFAAPTWVTFSPKSWHFAVDLGALSSREMENG